MNDLHKVMGRNGRQAVAYIMLMGSAGMEATYPDGHVVAPRGGEMLFALSVDSPVTVRPTHLRADSRPWGELDGPHLQEDDRQVGIVGIFYGTELTLMMDERNTTELLP